jgi:hypothetical protein
MEFKYQYRITASTKLKADEYHALRGLCKIRGVSMYRFVQDLILEELKKARKRGELGE